jgi:hypothetical protein
VSRFDPSTSDLVACFSIGGGLVCDQAKAPSRRLWLWSTSLSTLTFALSLLRAGEAELREDTLAMSVWNCRVVLAILDLGALGEEACLLRSIGHSLANTPVTGRFFTFVVALLSLLIGAAAATCAAIVAIFPCLVFCLSSL